MIKQTSFYFLRHGETEWNRLRRCQGRSDIPLNETGIAQAHAAKERMRGLE
ncbi:histidine phosphatase family protein, partial [Acinetobacter baumannii]